MAPAATTAVKAIKRDIPYAWEGKDKRGNRVKGKSLAPDEMVLRSELRRQGIAIAIDDLTSIAAQMPCPEICKT